MPESGPDLAQPRQVAPCVQERFLDCVLGATAVSKDESSEPVERPDLRSDQRGECVVIAFHRPLDQLNLQPSPHMSALRGFTSNGGPATDCVARQAVGVLAAPSRRTYNSAARRHWRRVSCPRPAPHESARIEPSPERKGPIGLHDLAPHRPLGDPRHPAAGDLHRHPARVAAQQPSRQSSIKTVLGLDLQGGVRVTLAVEPLPGQTVTDEQLETARNIIERRVGGIGVSEPQVRAEISNDGQRRIVVEVPGVENEQQVRELVGSTGQLQFIDPRGQTLTEGQDISEMIADGTVGVALRRWPDRSGQRGADTTRTARWACRSPCVKSGSQSWCEFTTAQAHRHQWRRSQGPDRAGRRDHHDPGHQQLHLWRPDRHHRRRAQRPGQRDGADQPLQHAALRRAAGLAAGAGLRPRGADPGRQLPDSGARRRRHRPVAGPVLHDRVLPPAGRAGCRGADLLHAGDLRDLPADRRHADARRGGGLHPVASAWRWTPTSSSSNG